MSLCCAKQHKSDQVLGTKKEDGLFGRNKPIKDHPAILSRERDWKSFSLAGTHFRLKYNTNQWNYALGSHLDHISDRSVVQNVTVPKINNDYFAVNYDNHQVDRAKELGKRYIKIEEGLTGGNSEVITCWNNGQTIDKLQPSIVPVADRTHAHVDPIHKSTADVGLQWRAGRPLDQTSSFGAASLENQRPHHSNWKLDRERSEMTEMTDDSLNESPVEVTNVGTTLPWLEVNNHTQGRLTSGHARDLVVRPNIKAIANGGILFGRVDGRDTEGQFIAYRRNYISITTACSLDNFHSMAPIYLDDKQVKAFGSELSSYIEDSSSISVKGRPVEMYQYTPKRDNKNRRPPDIIKVTPGLPLGTRNMKRENDLGRRSRSFGLGRCHDVQLPDLPLQLVPDEGVPVGTSSPVQDFGMKSPLVDAISNTSSYHHTWSRIQFKRATANNGQRRPTQQYFRLVITLLADVRPDNALRPVWVPVADLTSERIIVRGRSPIHYATDNVVANGKDNGREENDSDEARKGNSRKRKRLDEDIGHVNEHEDTGQSPGICHSDNEEIRKNSSSSSYDSSLDDVTYSTGFRSLNDNNNMNNINYNHMSNDTYSAYLSYNGSSSFSFNNCYPSIAPTPMSMFWRSDNPQSDFRNLSNNYNAMSFTSDPTTHDTSYEVKHASLSKLDTFPRSLTCNPAWYLDNNQPPQQSTQLHSQSQSQMQDNHQNRQSGDQQVQQSFDTSPLSLSYHNYHHSRDQYDQTLEPPLQSQVQSQVHPQIQSQSQLYRQNYDTVQYQNISSPLLYNSLNTRDQTSDSNNNNNNNDILFGSRSIRSNGYINGTGNNLLDVSR